LAKNLKLNIKNAQIAEAISKLDNLKDKLAKKKDDAAASQRDKSLKTPKTFKEEAEETVKESKEDAPRIRARSKSAFAEASSSEAKQKESEIAKEDEVGSESTEVKIKAKTSKEKTSEELRQEIFGEELRERSSMQPHREQLPDYGTEPASFKAEPVIKEPIKPATKEEPAAIVKPVAAPISTHVKLGPTGRHIKDLLPPPRPAHKPKEEPAKPATPSRETPTEASADDKNKDKSRAKIKGKGRESTEVPAVALSAEEEAKKSGKLAKFKEFRDVKPTTRKQDVRSFDARDRHGFRDAEEEQQWRKRRAGKQRYVPEDPTIRPATLKVRIPIAIKDLASEMKLKASQLIAKLFLQGVIVTLNDLLDDVTTIQLLGHEFGCEISIDTSEEERIRITDKSIKEEVQSSDPDNLVPRPPVVAFMGHVDHGKTSLIDTIRKSNRASSEAGAITQHIGAFRCTTPVGDIAILDTPGHEAFSAMRARGADVTDIVVLVVAGDEGIRQQTVEAINHAKSANVTIVVAINKSDKPNFNVETVYRQLADNDLLPEAWGGQTITVNCSAVTGEGVKALVEMLALQAEVLELRANPSARARGSVLESEMHKGMGSVATVLVQNGTLHIGDAVVFEQLWGRVKTMHDEFGNELQEAGPSTPVEITGLSGLPEAGQEFIVVKSEREAREIAAARQIGMRQTSLQQAKKVSMENLVQQASEVSKKMLNIVLRADVQGSLEALKVALQKIQSTKAELNIIFAGVGEVSESDVQLAATSKAVIIGFHTQIESHADALVKQLGVQVRLHNIIYHAIDDVKTLMLGLLDKIAQETDKGKVEIKAVFKSSHYGNIAGCIVTEGSVHRNHSIRVKRNGEVIWKGPLTSLKRVKEDVREVQKGLECGIVLSGFNEVQVGDILESYEITYISQEL